MEVSKPSEDVLLRDDVGGVCTLTLNRPAQFNCLSDAVLDALAEQIRILGQDRNTRVVILAGTGKAFCAGHDLKEMRAHPEKPYMQSLFRRAGQVMVGLLKLPQPVIARVHGVAAAAGCQLVANCDLAVAASDARFAVPGINVGLFCSTPGVALGRVMQRKQAMEMLLTGEFVDAVEAQRRGLVNRVVAAGDLDAEVHHLARTIVGKPPLAVAMGKAAFYQQLEMGIEAAYQFTAETMASNMMTEDAAHGIDCFMSRQAPVWQGR